MRLDHQALEPEQLRRLRRARRTAMTVALVAFAVFVFSIAQMLWLQHHPHVRTQTTTTDSLMQ